MEPSYPTDITDEKWELLLLLLPAAKPCGRLRTVDLRAMVDAIFYIAKGRKRHPMVDTLGLVMMGVVTAANIAANISDQQGARLIFERLAALPQRIA